MAEKEYIEREVLIKQFETLKEKAETLRDVVYLDGVLAVIDTTPTANVQEVRHGKWIEYDNGVQTCSECGEEHEWQDYRASYCEDCGAKMDKEENND